MDGSAHLFQFQSVWGNNEKSGSAISRQFDDNALGQARSNIEVSNSRVKRGGGSVFPTCVREREKERKKRKVGKIDRNEPVAQPAILHGWTTMLDYAILLNGTISMNRNRFPPMSLKGWSIITQCSILERPLRPEINRYGLNNCRLSDLFDDFSRSFRCFKIRESWWKVIGRCLNRNLKIISCTFLSRLKD